MRRSSRIRRMGRMLRRRIRKTETAWRKLCRFHCFSAPIHWGHTSCVSNTPCPGGSFFAEPQQGDSPSADGGNVAAPAAGAKRKGHLRFPFLFELLPFPCLLARRKSESGDRFENGVRQSGYRCVRFATCSQCQITYCYTGGQLYAGAT